jgi:sarcosine oxidase, subunit gamma
MADASPKRTPPLAVEGAGWSVCAPFSAYSLRVNLQDAQSALAAPAGSVPLPDPTFRLSLLPCRALSQGDWAALWLGPDEQLLIGPNADGPAMAQRIEAGLSSLPHALVDVSHRQSAIELRGRSTVAMLNTGCPLDLDLEAAPIGFCSRTVFAKAEIVLWRRDESCFQLQAWRSFLPYVTGLLTFAALEQGH